MNGLQKHVEEKLKFKEEEYAADAKDAGVAETPFDAEGKPYSKNALKKMQKDQQKEEKKQEKANRLAEEHAHAAGEEPDISVGKYGKVPVNQSREEERKGVKHLPVHEISARYAGQDVTITGRIQRSRMHGNKMVFMLLRQNYSSVQIIVVADSKQVSRQMVKWAAGISLESIVVVTGKVVKAPETITSATVKDAEVQVTEIHTVAETPAQLPIQVEDATRSDAAAQKEGLPAVNLDTRLDARVIDLRTPTNQAIFRIQSGVTNLFRQFLLDNDFTEIHTPKMLSAPSESGASAFEVNRVKGGNRAYLAQSPQLYKQMLMASDFDRVFEVAPVFRAENSNTHRHMTEFVGLDLEMAFHEHYDDVVELIGKLFVYIFTNLEKKYAKEIAVAGEQYPVEPFQLPPDGKPVRLLFKDGIKLLRENGFPDKKELEDLTTEEEKVLGKLVKDKYHTDFYVLDKFPLDCRPFYTMPDPVDHKYSNSYDFFMRGEEVLSGGQRIHDSDMLKKRMQAHGLDHTSPGFKDYVDAFSFGAPPHAGGGIGLERVVMLFLGLKNIRLASLFPRDPKRHSP